MDTQQNQEREEAWSRFCDETPEYGEPGTKEHNCLKDVYRKQYKNAVDDNVISYQEALGSARDVVFRSAGLSAISKSRDLGAGKKKFISNW